MGRVLDVRRRETQRRLDTIQENLHQAKTLAEGKACIYVTGSFAREFSDLDLFIAGETAQGERRLRNLDEICIKALLIEMTRKLGIPDFSGDGEYLEHYTVDDLIKTLGKPEDDATNTFTARLLLLLESRPLLGVEFYEKAVKDVIDAYWRDYEGHENEFIPAFLANDILRIWRTFCVNYEARTSTEPELKKAKRRLKNYKLKHSRLLSCYSALVYLLAIFRAKKTVHVEDAFKMVSLTPTTRLEWLKAQDDLSTAHSKVDLLLDRYESFLSATNASEGELVNRFLDPGKSGELIRSAQQFGDLMFDLLDSVGRGNKFFRLLVV